MELRYTHLKYQSISAVLLELEFLNINNFFDLKYILYYFLYKCLKRTTQSKKKIK